MFGLAQRQAIDLLADDFTAWIFGFMSAILVIPYFVRLDRGFDFRAVTGPLDRSRSPEELRTAQKPKFGFLGCMIAMPMASVGASRL